MLELIPEPTPPPEPAPEPKPKPTPPLEPTPELTPTQEPTGVVNNSWGKWGFSIWGSEYSEKATPGMSMFFYKGYLVTMLVPKDKVYYLLEKRWDSAEPVQLSIELTINETGNVATRESGKMLQLQSGYFARGEACQIALMSEDKTIMVFTKEIPNPIEGRQGDYRIWVELISPIGDSFIIWGEGFEPDEEIDTISISNGEEIKSKQKIDSDGRFMTILFPSVTGKESGLATFKAIGKSGEVEVSYEWGSAALNSEL